MDIQSIRSFSATQTSTSFEYEKESDIEEYLDRIQSDWDEERYEEVIKGIDVMLDQHLPALNAVLRSILFTVKSKCYEEMGQMDLALIEVEKAANEIDSHHTFLDRVCDFAKMDFDPFDYLAMRQAGLMFQGGRKEEAFDMLRSHQPKSVIGVLVYHLLDKESKISLLQPKTASDENDLMELFLAGRYEEVIEKTAVIYDEYRSSRPFIGRTTQIKLHAASLAMLGRNEEALRYFNRHVSYASLEEDIFSAILLELNGEPNQVPHRMDLEEEISLGFPIHLFVN